MNVVFNEIDPVACAVLRDCHDGTVLERSIKDLKSADLAGYERAHFFAGAGLWEVACDLAGWDRPIWTGSCPCQAESVAGKRLGARDPRDLWPDFFTLIAACRPAVVVGEQVDAAVSSHWLDRAAADMEGAGYAFRAVDIPACAVDAPHKRNRIYWIAVGDAANGERQRHEHRDDASGTRPYDADDAVGSSAVADAEQQRFLPGGRGSLSTQESSLQSDGSKRERVWSDTRQRDEPVAVADADCRGRDRRAQGPLGSAGRRDAAERADGKLGHSDATGLALGRSERSERSDDGAQRPSAQRANGSFWSDAEWLRCADGKARRSKPGVRLLVDGLVGRADLWRLAGNSIVPQIAAEVLIALKETLNEVRPVRVNDLFG